MTLQLNSAQKLGFLFAQLSRPQNTVVPILFCVFAALSRNHGKQAVLGTVLLLSLYAIATTYNNIVDVVIDRANKRTTNPIATNEMTKRQAYAWIIAMSIVVLGLQPFLIQPYSVVLTILYALLLYIYSNRTINLQGRGILAPLVLAGCYGVIPLLLGFSSFDAPSLSFALITGLLLVPLLLAKDYKDEAGDRQYGKRTILVRYGSEKTKQIALGFAICMFCISCAVIFSSAPWRQTVLVAGLGLLYLRFVYRIHETKGQAGLWVYRRAQLVVVLLAFCFIHILD